MDVINANATVIDTDLSALTEADKWLSAKRSEVAAELARHPDFDVTDTDSYRQAKAERAELNNAAKAIDTERKGMVSAINSAVKRFKASTDSVTEPLAEASSRFDAKCKQWESDVVARRRAMLVEAYEEAAPDIAGGLVPFDAIVNRFGLGQLGKKWMLFGTNDEVARNQLMEALSRIAEGERTVDSMVAEEDRETVKGMYFQTLDMEAAMAKARELSEQRERILALEAERRRREEEYRREQERLEQERLERERQERPEQQEPPVENPNPQPEVENKVLEHVVNQASQPLPGQPVKEYVFMAYCDSRPQLDALIAYCRQHGITGTAKPTRGRRFHLEAE